MADYPIRVYETSSLYEPGEEVPAHVQGQWTAQDYTLCVALGVDTNYDAEDLVAKSVADSPLAGAITFDSEAGCFFAYASSKDDIEALAKVIAKLVAAGPHPNAVPGDITASPAFIGTPNHLPPNWT